MSTLVNRSWITGEEFVSERLRLLDRGLGPGTPEYEALVRRIDERNAYLIATHAHPLMETHPGRWVAVSSSGEVLLGDEDLPVSREARERFGPGDYCVVRLVPGYGAPRLGPRGA